MMLISFDQGPMGHERRKPTRLGTNLVALKQLEGGAHGRSYTVAVALVPQRG